MRKFALGLVTLLFVITVVMGTFGSIYAEQGWPTISAQALKKKINNGDILFLINVSPESVFNAGHIKGSVNIPIGKLAISSDWPKDKNKPLIFYCMDVPRMYSSKAASWAVKNGYTNVAVFREGVLGWVKAGYQLASVGKYADIKIPIVNATKLSNKLRATSVLVDVRPQDHFTKGHIVGSTNIDLEDLYKKFRSLPKEKQIVLIDNHKGRLTLTTARFLVSRGYKNVAMLDGGFNAWPKAGLPVEK